MRFATVALLSLVSTAFAGNCGPLNKNAKCSATECCTLSTRINRLQVRSSNNHF